MGSGPLTAWALGVPLLVAVGVGLVTSRRRTPGRRRAGGEAATRSAATSSHRADPPSDEVPLHDQLTGLANRALLVENLDRALGRAGRVQTRVATVVVAVEEFRETWERLGHRAAEELVITAAARLESAVRPGDLVARSGVDEFTLLLDGFRGAEEVVAVAQHALALLAEPVTAGGRSLHVGASAGIAVSPEGLGTVRSADLIHQAGVAQALARRTGPGRSLMFDDSMRTQDRRPFDPTIDLPRATAARQIRVVYQPVVVLESMELVGFEALARWDHPEHGPVSPARFIPVAEETGDIIELGRCVLELACDQMASWSADPSRTLRIGVNISPRQLAHEHIVEDVRRALETSGLAPEQLVLEITESALHHDVASVRTRLQDLRAVGVRMAMDDFGTGYSSLAYLRRLPLDIVKVDKSFIDDGSEAGPRVLAGMADIGAQLGLDTVAEGIELPAQLAVARNAGCTFGQGFLIARPMEVDAATAFIAQHPAGSRIEVSAAHGRTSAP